MHSSELLYRSAPSAGPPKLAAGPRFRVLPSPCFESFPQMSPSLFVRPQMTHGKQTPCFSIQDFVRDDPSQRATHKGAALSRANQLFSGDCIHELQQIAIEIRVAFLKDWLEGQRCACQLSLQDVD